MQKSSTEVIHQWAEIMMNTVQRSMCTLKTAVQMMNIALEGKCKTFSAEVLWLHVVISHTVSTEMLIPSALLAPLTGLTEHLFTGQTKRDNI